MLLTFLMRRIKSFKFQITPWQFLITHKSIKRSCISESKNIFTVKEAVYLKEYYLNTFC